LSDNLNAAPGTKIRGQQREVLFSVQARFANAQNRFLLTHNFPLCEAELCCCAAPPTSANQKPYPGRAEYAPKP
jgi:hypothetical protein